MVEAAKFDDDHALTASDSWMESGFIVGGEVKLVRRITVELGPDKVRKDIPKGQVLTIAAFTDDKVVVVYDRGDAQERVHVKKESLELFKPDSTPESDKKGGQAQAGKCLKGLEFLGEANAFEVIKDWPNKLACHDSELKTTRLKESIGFMLGSLQAQAPQYSEEDRIVIGRWSVVAHVRSGLHVKAG